MSKKLLLGMLSFSVMGAYSCKQSITDTEVAQVQVSRPNAAELSKQYNYSSVAVPKGFERFANLLKAENPTTVSLFNSNPLTEGESVAIIGVNDAKAKLGRVLFYDKKLSINSTISCASCHHQDKGFSDGKSLSQGFEGLLTTRNSMSIVNPGMVRAGMFWDRRQSTVRDMSLNPVQNHIEMGMEDLRLLEIKLTGTDYYGQLFADAYGSPNITHDKISDALTAFLRSMVSWNSKFDQGVKNNFKDFTSDEKRGMEIFMGKQTTTSSSGGFFTIASGTCNTCHSAPMFNDGNTVNAYYDVDFLANLAGGGIDIGLDLVSKDKGAKNGGFKIPSLRNIEMTAPYMHDGRFKTLEEVVDHYNEGVKASPNLSSRLKDDTGKPKKLNLSEGDKKALVAFLKTLSDKEFVSNPKYSDPFQN